jgi:SHS2 domain-containing protein
MSRAEAAGYEFVDAVTSDVTFVARAASLEQLFAAAADALLAVTLEDPGAVQQRERRMLRLAEPDLELLLLRFLNELIYLRDAEQRLLRAAALHIASSGAGATLEGELAGERIDDTRHRLAADVKAATAHQLCVRREPQGWSARVTLDV